MPTDDTDTDTDTDEGLDYLCWYVISHLDHYSLPDEFVVGTFANDDPDTLTDADIKYEFGRVVGMWNVYDDLAAVLDHHFDIDVHDRADAYRQRNDFPEFEYISPDTIDDSQPDTFLKRPSRDPFTPDDIRERIAEYDPEDDQ